MTRDLSRRHATAICASAALTAVVCAGLLMVAALAPAPPAFLPFVIVICIVCPMAAAVDLPLAIKTLRSTNGRAALAELRRSLDALPEAPHPLDG